MKQFILGTAGHIDHGKTSLIKALTGIDLDRLKQEKERGITIELGFTSFTLPNGEKLGIVDVPGHEKFVKTMVAGACGIDLVMLIVAADDGIMPQTQEHLDICRLLGIKKGVIVITKTDLVEKEWVELIKEEVREFVSATFLQDAPIIPVSSLRGDGIPDLITELDLMVKQMEERYSNKIFRLPIDRVFSMKGFGTVVTGTVISGKVQAGDTIVILPQGIKTKIRGIQVYNEEVKSSSAGLRTAINLQGIEKSVIQRGDVLAGPEYGNPTTMIDVKIENLPNNPLPIKNGKTFRFHLGTSMCLARINILGQNEVKPGEELFAQILLDKPLVIIAQDRYVLRGYSQVQTIGGGRVLHPFPKKHKRFSTKAVSALKILASGKDEELIDYLIKEASFEGINVSRLAVLSGLDPLNIQNITELLRKAEKIIQIEKERNHFIHKDFYKLIRSKLLHIISDYHKKFPLKSGIPKQELEEKHSPKISQKIFSLILNILANEGRIVLDKDKVRLKSHVIELAAEQLQNKEMILEQYRQTELEPPLIKELIQKFPKISEKEIINLINVLVQENKLLKVKENLFFFSQSIQELQKKLISFLKKNKEINMGQFKNLTRLSRKFAVPLLEYFDSIKVTMRVGEKRVLRSLH
ncbi:MAG: selenocysteine-specific translation elongation factor [Thermodesulfobacteriota bacterium]|nr:selenocysteine-specific translation elongation factor [Thermodesulfobacteriota bacterium]